MRPDHLTFLVLAGAVALVAFALGGVPALLLPPALHSANRIGENGAQTRRKRAWGERYRVSLADALAPPWRARAGQFGANTGAVTNGLPRGGK